MELTKYNTALDLSKLTEDQIDSLVKNTNKVHLDKVNYPIFYLNTMAETYCQTKTDRLHFLVDFDTFKSIHFPEPSSRRQEEDNDCPRYPLFKHMADEHRLTLLDSEMDDIAKVVRECYFSVPYEELVEALQDLVSLKKIKDTQGKTVYYNDNLPKAWDKAKQLLERIK